MSRKRNRTRYRKPAAARKAVREEPSLPVQMKNPLTRNQALKDVLSALDGYSNALAFLGEDSPLISAGTFHRSGLTSQTELLTVTYRENWLAKRIIDMPCEDMTRAWYRLSTGLPEAELHRLKRLEAKHSVKQEIANAIRWARLYGGALALIVIRGEERRLDLPLDTDVLMPGCFQGLLVLDKAQGIEPSAELVRDLDDPDFGLPMFYTVTLDTEQGWENPAAADTEQAERRGRFCSSAFGVTSRSRPLVPPSDQMIAEDGYPTPTRVRIHQSRVLRFIGRELPRMETIAENYWGASELEHVWEELQKRSATSANIAQLIFQANITTLKMGNLGEHLAFGDENMRNTLMETLQNENRLRTSYGLQLMSSDDSLENHSYSFGGLSEIYEAFMMDMAGAAEIPATKLFGRSPQGMNSTGEADLRNYYDTIAQMQERHLRPALEKLLPVMAISCWGYAPEDMEIIFEPVMTTSPAERAELVQKMSSDVIEAFRAGLLDKQQALSELQARGERLGVYSKLTICNSE